MNNLKTKILLAEKDSGTIQFIKDILSEAGYEVGTVVETAIDAITKTEIKKPDIILLDVLLNGSLNGIEAAKIISYKYKIPIVFIVNNDSRKLLDQDYKFKFSKSVLLPADRNKLVGIIGNCLSVHNFTNTSVQDNLASSSEYSL